MYSDFHLHTSFSDDSDTDPEKQIERAIALRMSSICFTDHIDMDYPEGEFTFELDIDAYYNCYLQYREKYKNKIQLFFGVEFGMQPHLGPAFEEYTAIHPFDFVIGSNHLVRGMDPYYPEAFEGYTEDSTYRRYFEELLTEVTNCSSFDVMGHLDYIVRYGPNQNRSYSYEKYQDVIDEILRTVISKGKGIECNTSGLRNLGVPHPMPQILTRYREMGGEILTIGSDAHVPEHLGFGFDRIGEILKACGFRYYTTFAERKPEFHKL